MATLIRYSLDVIRDEARQLVEQGILSRHQPIYTLCRYIPASEWPEVERELEFNEFLLRERIIDLLPTEEWKED